MITWKCGEGGFIRKISIWFAIKFTLHLNWINLWTDDEAERILSNSNLFFCICVWNNIKPIVWGFLIGSIMCFLSMGSGLFALLLFIA